MQSSIRTPSGAGHAIAIPRAKSRGAHAAWPAASWTVASLVLLVQLRSIDAGAEEMFQAVEVDLPELTRHALAASAFLHDPAGLLIAGGALAATLAPFAFGARGRVAGSTYFALALLAFLTVAGTWLAVDRPLAVLTHELEIPASPLGR